MHQDDPATQARAPKTAAPSPPASSGPADISGPGGALHEPFNARGDEGQTGTGPGADDVEAAASEVPKTRGRVLKRLMILLGLALAALVTGAWAIALFPDRPPLVNPTPFVIEIDSKYVLSEVNLYFSPGTKSVQLTVSADAALPVAATRKYGYMHIDVFGGFP